MAVELLKSPQGDAFEIAAAEEDPYGPAGPSRGQYWAPPIDLQNRNPNVEGKEYRLTESGNIRTAWWIPITQFEALRNFVAIAVAVKNSDVYLSLLGVRHPTKSGAVNIQVFVDK